MKANNLTPVQWYSLKSEDLRGKLTLGAITITQYYEELNSILGVALEMEKEQINDEQAMRLQSAKRKYNDININNYEIKQKN